MIALTIVFVAAEILHARRGRIGLAARMPWIVAFTFGLLHGFGFAGALSEVGLPAGKSRWRCCSSISASRPARCCSSPPCWPCGGRAARSGCMAALGGAGAALCHRQRGDVLGDPARGRLLKP